MTRFLFLLILLWLPAACTFAQDTAADDEKLTEDEIVERILDLQRQIQELVQALPPETRTRVMDRLAVAPDAPPAAAEPAPAPPAVAAEPAAPSESAVIADAPVAAPPPAPVPHPDPLAVAESEAEPEPPPVRRRLTRGPQCNFLEFLDSNEDGKISAFDRYWRHLYLWTDSNGDRQAQEDEIESAYDLKVREIAVDLGIFLFKKGHIGEVRVEELISLDVAGDGLGGGNDRVLVVDATKLARGTGPKISTADGEVLTGFQAFRAGWRIEHDGDQVTVLECR